MALGYGYVQRDPEDQQLNWAQIGKDVSDRLENEITRREEKKEQLDNLTSDLVKELNTSQFLTENSNFNKFVLDSSDTIKNQTLLANKLLKSGQLKPRDFTIMMQNLIDGTDQTFGLFQDYKDEYDKKMAMMDEGLPVSEQGSNIMYDILENVEGFSNFQNHQLVLNNNTGVMSIGKVIDGKVSTNPNDLTTVEQLKNRIRTTINKFDLYGSADSYVESLGETTEEIINVGNKYRSTEIQRITGVTGGTFFDLTDEQIKEGIEKGIIDESDLKALNEFKKGIDTYIESQLGIEGTFSAASLLADYFPGYSTTFDENEAKADSKKILLRSVNGRVVADLSDEQMDLAKDALRTTITNGLSKKVETKFQQTERDASAQTASEKKLAQRRETLKDEVELISAFYSGDPSQMQKAETYWNGIYPGLSISRTTDNKLVLKQEGKKPVTYDLTGFESEGDFIEAISGRLIGGDLSEVNRITSSDAAKYGSNEVSLINSDVTMGDVLSKQERLIRISDELDNRITQEPNKLSFRITNNTPQQLKENILEQFPELELEISFKSSNIDKDDILVFSSPLVRDLKGNKVVFEVEAGRYTDSGAIDSENKFRSMIEQFYKLSGKENELIGLNATPMPEVEEVEEEAETKPQGAMSGFVKKKDKTESAVNTNPPKSSKSRYGHIIAMEEGFGGAPNAQGVATPLVGVYNEDQAREYENSTKQLKSYATGEMSFYGAEGNKNRNPKKGLRTDVTAEVYDGLSDNAKLILQTEHFNLGWDPRVLLLKVAGMMGNNTRGELHNDGDKLLKQWNSIINDPTNLAKFKEALEGKEEEMIAELESIMNSTTGNNNKDQYAKRIAYLRNLL